MKPNLPPQQIFRLAGDYAVSTRFTATIEESAVVVSGGPQLGLYSHELLVEGRRAYALKLLDVLALYPLASKESEGL